MPRIAERRERPVKICRMEGRFRDQVATVDAFNLPDAIKRWYEQVADEQGFEEPLFKANTVTLLTRDVRTEIYVATD